MAVEAVPLTPPTNAKPQASNSHRKSTSQTPTPFPRHLDTGRRRTQFRISKPDSPLLSSSALPNNHTFYPQQCRPRPRSPLAKPAAAPSPTSSRASTRSTYTSEYVQFCEVQLWPSAGALGGRLNLNKRLIGGF
jgi:hypothetical protein